MTISDLNMQPMQNRSLGNAFYSLIKKYFTGSTRLPPFYWDFYIVHSASCGPSGIL